MALAAVIPCIAASAPNPAGAPTQMVITAKPAHQGGGVPDSMAPGDVALTQGKTRLQVQRVERLSGDLADMQLFVLLDDSTRSSSLGIQLPDLRTFLKSLPVTTQVAVGYMQNGTFRLAQAFTTDHQKAASALRLPIAIPGENGSPYFALSDLARHWPSKEPAGRRVVLMLTDGVDRYWGTRDMDDPYVDTAVQDALKNGVMIYSIYLRGAGMYGRGGWVTTFGQSLLLEVTGQTGGFSYFQAMSDPVTITPFLTDFHNRLENQYMVTFEALSGHGVQTVQLRTELPGMKVEGPSRIYVR
jgi:hypothetical protein